MGPDRFFPSEALLTDEVKRGIDGVPALLSVEDVAALLSVHPSTIKRERSAGRLRSIRIGRRVLFRPEEVESYVRRQQEGEDGCPKSDSLNTANTGWCGEPTAPVSTSIGVARELDASAAAQRARATLTRRNGS